MTDFTDMLDGSLLSVYVGGAKMDKTRFHVTWVDLGRNKNVTTVLATDEIDARAHITKRPYVSTILKVEPAPILDPAFKPQD